MHIPDGFINAGTSLGAGVAAAAGVSAAVRRAGDSLREKEAPLAGLVAAFVFAAQMINFPVVAGTSGHLIGGVLAAVLIGPWAGALCLTVVVLVQALFADGGLTALGLNVLNMALIGCLGGYLAFRGLRWVTGTSRHGVAIAAAGAAWISVVLSALAFSLEYAIGGTTAVSPKTVLAAVVGVHSLIGIGEAAITAMTVAAVMSVRPDLVYGARRIPARVPTAA